VKPSELIKLAETVIKLDRLVRGEATDRTENDVDFSQYTVDELRKLNELLTKK
jgi:hypothetical protein